MFDNKILTIDLIMIHLLSIYITTSLIDTLHREDREHLPSPALSPGGAESEQRITVHVNVVVVREESLRLVRCRCCWGNGGETAAAAALPCRRCPRQWQRSPCRYPAVGFVAA